MERHENAPQGATGEVRPDVDAVLAEVRVRLEAGATIAEVAAELAEEHRDPAAELEVRIIRWGAHRDGREVQLEALRMARIAVSLVDDLRTDARVALYGAAGLAAEVVDYCAAGVGGLEDALAVHGHLCAIVEAIDDVDGDARATAIGGMIDAATRVEWSRFAREAWRYADATAQRHPDGFLGAAFIEGA